MTTRRGATALCAGGLAFLCACAAPVDYGPYRRHMPGSILVLPPLNESTAVNAPYTYLSTVSRPLAECGYYVFPVAVIDAFMKDNGLPTADEMQSVPLTKIREVIGADAVLYVTIEDWGQKYQIISSTTIVRARARLVDAATGATLWTGTEQMAQGSGGAESGIIGMLVAALVHQIVYAMTDQTYQLSRQATTNMVFNESTGLLSGPRSPRYASDPRGR